MLKNFKLTLLLVLMGANVLPAATWYVDGTATGSHTGTSWANAWTSLGNISGVSAGDTVYVSGGASGSRQTYSTPVTWSPTAGVTYAVGTDNAHNGTAVLSLNVACTANNVTLSGFTLSPTQIGGGSLAGYVYGEVLAGTKDVITNCNYTAFGATASQQATMIVVTGTSNTVENCLFHDMNDIDVFHIWGNNHSFLNNVMTNINEVNYQLNHTDFFQTWDGNSYNILIAGNLGINSTCQLGNTELDTTGLTTGWTFENNVFRNIGNCFFSGMPNTFFYNNVFDNVGASQGSPIIWYYSTSSGNQRVSTNCAVMNTVFYNCGSMGTSGGIALSTISQVDNYSGNSPGFVNEANADYHLAAGSMLIGKGTNLFSVFTTDKDGNMWPSSGAWDIGAYHYGAGGSGTNLNPLISVSPTNLYFVSVTNAPVTNTLTVQNVGGGTLAGTASVPTPFQIVSGGTYSLTSSQSQTVTVRYSPNGISTNCCIAFTGGGGASVPVHGSVTNYPPPTVSSITQNGADIDPGAAGLQIFAGSVVQYSGSASDPSGLPLTWQWIYTVNGGSEMVMQSGTGTVASVSFNYTSGTAGNTYVWKLRVSNGYATSESDLTVGVEAPPAGNVIQATSGTINSPFVATNGYIYQPVQTTNPTNAGSAYYNFTITNAGSYVIQALVSAPNDGANSFYVNIDAEPQDPTMIWDIPLTSGFEERVVSWRGNGTDTSNQFVPQIFNLGQGTHQLVIRGREANVELENFAVLQVPSPPQNLRILP